MKAHSNLSNVQLIGSEVFAARGTPPIVDTPIGGIYINVSEQTRWEIAVKDSWLSPLGTTSGKGPGLFTFSVSANTGSHRETDLSISSVTAAGKKLSDRHTIQQQGGAWLKEQEDMVLAAPFLLVPRTMELAIAAKWIAKQVSKIPEPFMLIALVIVEILVAVLGLTAMAAWALLSPIQPLQKPVYPYPEMPTMSPILPPQRLPLPPRVLEMCPITTAVMAMETLTTMAYIAIHSLEGE